MFQSLKEQPADKILASMQKYKEDTRDSKIDRCVCVSKTVEALTPAMRAAKTAGQQVWERETTKSYDGLVGDPQF